MPLLCIYLHTVLEVINKDSTDRIPAEQAAVSRSQHSEQSWTFNTGLQSSGYILAISLDTEREETAFHSGMEKSFRPLRNLRGSCHGSCMFPKHIHHYHKWGKGSFSTSFLCVTSGVGHFFMTQKLMCSLKQDTLYTSE